MVESLENLLIFSVSPNIGAISSVVKTVKCITNFQLYMNIICITTLEINYH